ncbi:MAG TPA: molybdopterin converting factor subunit 1 [Acidobacteriota bacterium]|nr:molybdopterin converting factor subunit 1 [Acidobacteriota bacterium]
MSIRVLFFATMAEITGTRETSVESSGYTDVISVFNKFARDFPLLEGYRASVLLAVNSEFARPDTSVRDGDEVAFFPPVSGG